jgi:hypothetical protein
VVFNGRAKERNNNCVSDGERGKLKSFVLSPISPIEDLTKRLGSDKESGKQNCGLHDQIGI